MQATVNGITYEVEQCSMCVKGNIFHPHTGRFEPCPLCRGRGTLITSHKCACGGPVIMASEEDKILYCGNKTCLSNLKADLQDRLKTTQPVRGHGPYPLVGWDSDRWVE